MFVINIVIFKESAISLSRLILSVIIP